MQFFDTGNDVADLSSFQRFARLVGRGKNAEVVRVVDRVRSHHLDTLAFAQPSINDTHQHDYTHIGVEPTVNDHGAQGRVWVALWRRNFGDYGFENFFDTHARFGGTRNRVGGVYADDVFNFCFGIVWISLWQIHFVEHWQNLNAQVEGGVAIGNGLCFDTLASVHH